MSPHHTFFNCNDDLQYPTSKIYVFFVFKPNLTVFRYKDETFQWSKICKQFKQFFLSGRSQSRATTMIIRGDAFEGGTMLSPPWTPFVTRFSPIFQFSVCNKVFSDFFLQRICLRLHRLENRDAWGSNMSSWFSTQGKQSSHPRKDDERNSSDRIWYWAIVLTVVSKTSKPILVQHNGDKC